MTYEMEKQLKDNGEKLSEEDKQTVQTAIDDFKKVREGNNVEEIKNAMEPFAQKVYAVFGKLYQHEGAQGGQPTPDAGAQGGDGTQTPPTNDDGTVEGDFDVH